MRQCVVLQTLTAGLFNRVQGAILSSPSGDLLGKSSYRKYSLILDKT